MRPAKGSTLMTPLALLPIAMSLAALSLVAIAWMSGSLVAGRDEGTAAHLWQALVFGQAPLLVLFLAKQVPIDPQRAMLIFALQVSAVAAAIAPIALLGL